MQNKKGNELLIVNYWDQQKEKLRDKSMPPVVIHWPKEHQKTETVETFDPALFTNLVVAGCRKLPLTYISDFIIWIAHENNLAVFPHPTGFVAKNKDFEKANDLFESYVKWN